MCYFPLVYINTAHVNNLQWYRWIYWAVYELRAVCLHNLSELSGNVKWVAVIAPKKRLMTRCMSIFCVSVYFVQWVLNRHGYTCTQYIQPRIDFAKHFAKNIKYYAQIIWYSFATGRRQSNNYVHCYKTSWRIIASQKNKLCGGIIFWNGRNSVRREQSFNPQPLHLVYHNATARYQSPHRQCIA